MIKKSYWENLKYILEHKKNVYIEGRKLGLGRWQLLMHDLSKFSPAEFKQYAASFFGGSRTDDVKNNFTHAWLNHKHKNKHHWQYWLDIKGKVVVPLEMPLLYEKEMVADWNAMSRKFHPDKPVKEATMLWFINQEDIILHENTRKSIWFYFEHGVFDTGYTFLTQS